MFTWSFLNPILKTKSSTPTKTSFPSSISNINWISSASLIIINTNIIITLFRSWKIKHYQLSVQTVSILTGCIAHLCTHAINALSSSNASLITTAILMICIWEAEKLALSKLTSESVMPWTILCLCRCLLSGRFGQGLLFLILVRNLLFCGVSLA